MGISFFRFGKFSSLMLLKIFTGPLSWDSSLSSIPIILRFGLFIMSYISSIWWARTFLPFLKLLCQCFLKYIFAWDFLFSLGTSGGYYCIYDLVLFPWFYISRIVSLCDFIIVSISIFRSWLVLFNSFTCLFVCVFCNSLRDFCVSSLRISTWLAVFSCISLSELWMPVLMSSTPHHEIWF